MKSTLNRGSGGGSRSHGSPPPRLRWALTAALVLAAACGAEPRSEAGGEHNSGSNRDAGMARDANAGLQQRLAETSGRPPVIALDEVARRVGADAALRQRLEKPVAALNATLIQLAELHTAHDSARATDTRHEIDRRANPLHLEADVYESQIDAGLTPDQHKRFHEYLRERVQAAGLPLDDSHGAEDTGAAGGVHTVGHPQGQAQHEPPQNRGSGAAPVRP